MTSTNTDELTAMQSYVAERIKRLERGFMSFPQRELDAMSKNIDLVNERRQLRREAQQLAAIAKEQPELFSHCKDKLSFVLDVVQDEICRSEEHPVERLLKWTREASDQSFLLGECFDVLGKDEYRTLKVLLRDAINAYDPVRAQSFF